MKKWLRMSGSQVHRGKATIWWNYRMMKAAMKKKKDDVFTCKICNIPWMEMTKNGEIEFNAIYAMNISAQSAMSKEKFPQIITLL